MRLEVGLEEFWVTRWLPFPISILIEVNNDSSFPDSLDSRTLNLDGVVVDPGSLPNGTIPKYDLGITLVHETGHWLGLLHTFQDPDGPFIHFGTGCTGDGDFVYDTPAEESPAFGCQEVCWLQQLGMNIKTYNILQGRDTCKENLSLSKQGLDPIHNYMDYSDDCKLYQRTHLMEYANAKI